MNKDTKFLLKLLSFNSKNIDHEPDIKCVRCCCEELGQLGFDCDFQIFKDVANLYAVLKKTRLKKRKTLYLTEHCDVVTR